MQTSHARRVDPTLARGSRQQFVERADCSNSRLGRQRRGVQQRPFGESGKRVCSGAKRSRQLVGAHAWIRDEASRARSATDTGSVSCCHSFPGTRASMRPSLNRSLLRGLRGCMEISTTPGEMLKGSHRESSSDPVSQRLDRIRSSETTLR